MQKLQALIVHYERQLHCPITRSQRVVIDKLLHHDFFEIGRSGMQFDKQQVIDALISETAEQPIQADNFELSVVDEKSVLLTYLSYKADENNTSFTSQGSSADKTDIVIVLQVRKIR
ncbi:nuclear transport factor 2 family protein [Pectobacterium aroidearum]|uniref:nuclear transport factor 2 family protein n=1 Tax=Pectobacterium aroidearum TaxID=1201031 RepID=UPI0033151A0D